MRYIGYSNWSAWRAATALQMQRERGWAQFTSGQMYYSLLDRDVEHEVVPFMRAAGLSLNVWSPLAGGFLSGKYTRENLGQSDHRLSGFDFFPFDKERGFQIVEKIRAIANEHNASVAQIALAWLLAKPVVGSIILGASKLSQLEDNLRATEIKLGTSDFAALMKSPSRQCFIPIGSMQTRSMPSTRKRSVYSMSNTGETPMGMNS